MKASFWHEAWKVKKIGFHQAEINSQLMSYWPLLNVPIRGRVFVPLCGKSSDMLWLARQHQVTGIELSEVAVREFFTENELPATVREEGSLCRFSGPNVDCLCGDLFELPDADISEFDAVYDRAALVALPSDMRQRYADKLSRALPGGAAMLLITIEYDTDYAGPPFAITRDEVERLYAGSFDIVEAGSNQEDFKGMLVTNRAYTLSKKL